MDSRTIRIANQADLKFVLDLQRKFSNQIGYLPAGPTNRELERGRILVGELNATEAGMLLWQPQFVGQPKTAGIIQAAVAMDAQKRYLGLRLVSEVIDTATKNGSTILQAWCRSDLESNAFWQALGFLTVATRPGGTSKGKPHLLWRLALNQTANLYQLPNDKYSRGPGGKFSRQAQATIPELVAN